MHAVNAAFAAISDRRAESDAIERAETIWDVRHGVIAFGAPV